MTASRIEIALMALSGAALAMPVLFGAVVLVRRWRATLRWRKTRRRRRLWRQFDREASLLDIIGRGNRT